MRGNGAALRSHFSMSGYEFRKKSVRLAQWPLPSRLLTPCSFQKTAAAPCGFLKLTFDSRPQSITRELGEVPKLVGIIVRQVMLSRVIARRSETWVRGHIVGDPVHCQECVLDSCFFPLSPYRNARACNDGTISLASCCTRRCLPVSWTASASCSHSGLPATLRLRDSVPDRAVTLPVIDHGQLAPTSASRSFSPSCDRDF